MSLLFQISIPKIEDSSHRMAKSGIYLLLLALSILQVALSARHVITQEILNQVNKMFHPALQDEIRKVKIGKINGEYNGVDYRFTNVRVTDWSSISSSMRDSGNNTFVMSVNVPRIGISGKWKAKWGWISPSGSATAIFRGVRISVNARLRNNNGRLSVSRITCSASVTDVSITFRVSRILNLFKSAIEGQLKGFMEPEICKAIKDNERRINEELGKYPVGK